jgi:hypothetical protein
MSNENQKPDENAGCGCCNDDPEIHLELCETNSPAVIRYFEDNDDGLNEVLEAIRFLGSHKIIHSVEYQSYEAKAFLGGVVTCHQWELKIYSD